MEGLEFLGNSESSLLGGESSVSDPLVTLGVLEDGLVTLLEDLSSWVLVSSSLHSVWVGKNLLVDLLVEFLVGLNLGGGKGLLPLAELSLELLWVFLLEEVGVVGNVSSKDSGSKDGSVINSLGLLNVLRLSSLVGDNLSLGSLVTWESLGLVWNVKSSIASSLQDSEDSGSGGSGVDTNIEESLEWSLVLNIIINVEVLSVDVGVSSVHIGKTNLLEKSSGQEKTSGISS